MQRFAEFLGRTAERVLNASLPDPEIDLIEESLHLKMDKLARTEMAELLGHTPNFTIRYDFRVTEHGAFIIRFHDIPSEKQEDVISILLRNRLTALTPHASKSKTPGMMDVEGILPHKLNYNPMDRL